MLYLSPNSLLPVAGSCGQIAVGAALPVALFVALFPKQELLYIEVLDSDRVGTGLQVSIGGILRPPAGYVAVAAGWPCCMRVAVHRGLHHRGDPTDRVLLSGCGRAAIRFALLRSQCAF